MRLTKHHGLGNDFLVLVDPDGREPIGPAEAVALCDRRTGIGADGVLLAAPRGDSHVGMVLLNADGSRAEMSGNGIRCLAQAVLQAGIVEPPTIRVVTDAGVRLVTLVARVSPSTWELSVDMGAVKVVDDEPGWVQPGIRRAALVEVGNPHLVLHGEPGAPGVAELGRRANEVVPGGVNVEVIRVGDGGDVLDMDVYERGVGLTRACGTGATAAAAAALEWGLAGEHVVVRMPGGDVTVDVGDTVTLTGPATSVAVVETPWP